MSTEKSRTQILEKEGWKRQFEASEPRLSEAVELYKQAGLEVHLEPFPRVEKRPECAQEQTEEKCRTCFKGNEDQYKIIFTRPLQKAL